MSAPHRVRGGASRIVLVSVVAIAAAATLALPAAAQRHSVRRTDGDTSYSMSWSGTSVTPFPKPTSAPGLRAPSVDGKLVACRTGSPSAAARLRHPLQDARRLQGHVGRPRRPDPAGGSPMASSPGWTTGAIAVFDPATHGGDHRVGPGRPAFVPGLRRRGRGVAGPPRRRLGHLRSAGGPGHRRRDRRRVPRLHRHRRPDGPGGRRRHRRLAGPPRGGLGHLQLRSHDPAGVAGQHVRRRPDPSRRRRGPRRVAGPPWGPVGYLVARPRQGRQQKKVLCRERGAQTLPAASADLVVWQDRHVRVIHYGTADGEIVRRFHTPVVMSYSRAAGQQLSEMMDPYAAAAQTRPDVSGWIAVAAREDTRAAAPRRRAHLRRDHGGPLGLRLLDQSPWPVREHRGRDVPPARGRLSEPPRGGHEPRR